MHTEQQQPEVSVSGGSAVSEGGAASFTLTASPAPAANLAVSVTVSQSGDYGASTGQRTVTIPTSGSVTLTVATTDDQADEPDGSVTVTLVDGAAYDLGASKTAAVAVADDDDPPVVDGQDGQDEPLTACEGDPELLISSPTASRGDASVDFEVGLSCIPEARPTLLLVPVRDGEVGEYLFVDLTAEEPSATVTLTIGSERELSLALGWSSGLANRDAQGDVVFSD